MKIDRKSHQQLQQLAMRRLQLAGQLISMQISRHVGCSLPAPPGAINAAESYPHCQPELPQL
jgi:hypothetical protein